MGRPPRLQDHNLARRLDELLVLAGSSRKLALLFGLDPATLSRSMTQRAFAAGTRAKILARIESVTSRLSGELGAGDLQAHRVVPNGEMLQILQKLYTLLPGAIAALEAVASSPLHRGDRQGTEK